MCKGRDSLTDIQSTGLGDLEREWLHLVRLHCMSYEHNHAEGWDRAISHAEVKFGADNGPGIASRIAVLIRAMREERRGGFGYLSPFCPSCRLRVTEDEWQLITLMQAGIAASLMTSTRPRPSLRAAPARPSSRLPPPDSAARLPRQSIPGSGKVRCQRPACGCIEAADGRGVRVCLHPR